MTLADVVIPILIGISYLWAAVLVFSLRSSKSGVYVVVYVLGVVATILHAGYMYSQFWVPAGIDLAIYPIVLLVTMCIVIIVQIEHFYRPERAKPILFVSYIFVGPAIALGVFFHQEGTQATTALPGLTVHVLSSLAAYSILAYAACHAILLIYLDYALRTKATNVFLSIFPPLESAEKILFNAIWLGLLLLTGANVSGLVFFWDDLFSDASHLHMIFTMIAWVLYAFVMFGHVKFGWRGNFTTKLSLTAFAFLLAGYFGLRLLLRLIA